MTFTLRPLFALPLALALASLTGCATTGTGGDPPAHGGHSPFGGSSDREPAPTPERTYSPHHAERYEAHREMPTYRDPTREIECWRCGH